MEQSLFVIEQELRNLFEGFNEEQSDDVRAMRLAILSDALTQKTDQVAAYRESLSAFVDYLNKKTCELEGRIEQYEEKIERFDEYVLNCLSIQDKKEFTGNLYKITKRKPSQSVEVFDETKIPIEFIKMPEPKPMVMKAEIAKALKQGELVEGARLVDGKVSVLYKIK
jgi:septation ring formation regulator EzrA